MNAVFYEPAERVGCAVCGMEKHPRGRDPGVVAASGYCANECPGHYHDPHPGFFWPSERADAADGIAAFLSWASTCGAVDLTSGTVCVLDPGHDGYHDGPDNPMAAEEIDWQQKADMLADAIGTTEDNQ